MENDANILLKINDAETDTSKWVHLCYADENLYNTYLFLQSDEYKCMNPTLSAWAKEDFNVDLSMDSIEDIATLKKLVKEAYREKYPEIYRDSPTDRQGWLRIWVNNKMKEAIDNANRRKNNA